ncbi:invasion associated locus B family protein [Acuticoccus mangrovi]|uniref:Invasion associated locus B family protein n=1 Tax=Acuticoccus mangrovi TaxID=2796142 RepID=A0A934IJ70_9HYPH|nr:invasion associated locus B family protein [Acuticoccus mangrovi]
MSRIVFLITAVLALLAGVLGSTGDAAAQGRIAARHGDWQIRCERPVGAPSEQCALVQNVEAQDRANVGLTVIFLRTADRQARILRVLAPLGVLLPSGLGLSIDNNEVGLAGFVRCLPEGCIAEVELDDGLIERFEAGNTATFVIFQTPEEGIGIPISLNGFTSGFAALDNPPPPSAAVDDDAPTGPVATATEVVDRPATPIEPSSFTLPPDDRTDLDRLLEDDLFPIVAGAVAIFVIMIVGAITLIVRAGRRRKRRRDSDDGYDDEDDEDDDLDELEALDDDDEEDEDLTAPRRLTGAHRRQPRLAPPSPERHLPDDEDEDVPPRREPARNGPRRRPDRPDRPGPRPGRMPTAQRPRPSRGD